MVSSSGKRAQSTVETLLILAIALFIMLFLVSIVYDQLNQNYITEQRQIASVAVNSLAREIDDAYFLGPGTVKNVTIVMPDTIDYTESFIAGKNIVLQVAGSPVIASTRVDARGSWPNIGGSYVFVITTFDEFVAVSTQPVAFSPSQASVSIQQGSLSDFNIAATNTGPQDLGYNIVIEFPNPAFSGVSLSTSSPTSVIFPARGSVAIPFTLSCSRDSFGSYYGRVVFVPESASDSNLTVPVNLICFSAQTRLNIFPQSKTILGRAGSVSSDSVIVCNNSAATLHSASALVSGAASSFVFTNFSGDLPANSCRPLDINISSPPQISNYSGTLSIFAAGLFASSDLNLSVGFNLARDYTTTDFNAGTFQHTVLDSTGVHLDTNSGGYYYPDGNFYSRVFDLGSRADFNTLYWRLSGTGLFTMYVRSSDDNVSWNAWQSMGTAGPRALLLDSNRYFQYWAKFTRSGAGVGTSRILSDVNVSYIRIGN